MNRGEESMINELKSGCTEMFYENGILLICNSSNLCQDCKEMVLESEQDLNSEEDVQ